MPQFCPTFRPIQAPVAMSGTAFIDRKIARQKNGEEVLML
jgi:hypothetical protein